MTCATNDAEGVKEKEKKVILLHSESIGSSSDWQGFTSETGGRRGGASDKLSL